MGVSPNLLITNFLYFPMTSFKPISVSQLADRLSSTDSMQLIDVREPEEVAIASLPNFANLPLSQFAEWSETIATQLDPGAETIVMCHHGIRSAQMCQWLVQQGFMDVSNVVGGIAEYAAIVDAGVPQY
jgi:rhodanese-related sulfurtransferase